jgi:hypothetical protein
MAAWSHDRPRGTATGGVAVAATLPVLIATGIRKCVVTTTVALKKT